ncbi:MAG: hypothetical protein K6C41_05720, partial [Lachnospiraceae bacterium]|nr:hypothetical protein [Lachnospiraceae bacterium]
SRALRWTAVFTMIISMAVCSGLLIRNALDEATGLLKGNVADVSQDISDEFLEYNTKNAVKIKDAIWKYMYYLKRCSASEATEYLKVLLGTYDCDEINIIDSDGFVENSSLPKNIGFDLSKSERSASFLPLLNMDGVIAQEPRRSLTEAEVMMVYAGASFPDQSGFVLIGSNMETLRRWL